jgi:hypothetical protein
VIIDDLDIEGAAGIPSEADPPLVIDANAVLATPISLQGLEPVARRHRQILQNSRSMKV